MQTTTTMTVPTIAAAIATETILSQQQQQQHQQHHQSKHINICDWEDEYSKDFIINTLKKCATDNDRVERGLVDTNCGNGLIAAQAILLWMHIQHNDINTRKVIDLLLLCESEEPQLPSSIESLLIS
jgi:hypothetical protein